MNYCNRAWNNNGQLSDVDRYMVKAAYGDVPRFHSTNKFVCFPVVLSEGSQFSGCLRQSGSKWEVFDIVATSKKSIDPATLSNGTLSIPFVYSYDGQNVTGFYRNLTFQQDADGLFKLTSTATFLN
ncbi:MAG: hypothetical protein KAH20_10950 [Methylococcales bacterium]|nr:hypothetical protein [Methylococcales bacterium]